MKRWTPEHLHDKCVWFRAEEAEAAAGKALWCPRQPFPGLEGLPPFRGWSFTFPTPINTNPFWLLACSASRLLQLLLLWKQPHGRGIHSRGLLQVWFLCCIYGSGGAGRSAQVSGSGRRKIISIVGRKGNLMGELIGLFLILNCVQRICLSVNIIPS